MDLIRNNPGVKLSESVQAGNMIYLSGKLPADLTQDIDVQAASLLNVLEETLIRAKSDKSHIVFAQIFLKHASDAAKFNEHWNKWLPANEAPARICVEANMLNNDVLVEAALVAVPAN